MRWWPRLQPTTRFTTAIALLEQHTCYIYNSSYDTRLIRQTASLYGLPFDSSKYSFSCVMEDYAYEFNDGFWEKLILHMVMQSV